MTDEAAARPSHEAATRDEAGTRLEAIAPGYLGRVRRTALRLAHRDSTDADATMALADVEDTAAFDLDAPTLSRLRVGRLIKLGVKKLVGWYLRYLTQQLAAFSRAVSRFGAVLVARADQIEETTATLGRDLERLRRRVERLEGAGPQRLPAEGDREPEDGSG